MQETPSAKIKVLIISSKLHIGGAEKVAADIGFNADKNLFEIHYLVFGDKIGEYESELEDCGCKIIHIPEPAESFVNYLKNLKKLIRKYKYSVIHAHTMFNIGWAMALGKRCGVPIRVAHAHSQLLEKRNLKTRIYEAIMRFLILTCSTDLVSCGKAAGERLYGKKVFKKKGQLILNGTDCKSFAYSEEKRKMIRAELGLGDAFIIGHAGHLAPVKNQSFLIELMPDILKKNPNAFLLLLGNGPDKAMLEQKIAELQLEENVIMTGNVRNVADYLSATDVFAFPSLYEGMPLTLIEAQANGLPTLVSENITQQLMITDLISNKNISQGAAKWAEFINNDAKQRRFYTDKIREAGFDIRTEAERLQNIYLNEAERAKCKK